MYSWIFPNVFLVGLMAIGFVVRWCICVLVEAEFIQRLLLEYVSNTESFMASAELSESKYKTKGNSGSNVYTHVTLVA